MVIKRPLFFIIFLLIIPGISGCASSGLIYTDVTTPYSRNFKGTPAGSKKCVVENHEIREPISRYKLGATWDTSALVAAAKKAGIKDIHYIDRRTLKILFGIYKRETFIIYGD